MLRNEIDIDSKEDNGLRQPSNIYSVKRASRVFPRPDYNAFACAEMLRCDELHDYQSREEANIVRRRFRIPHVFFPLLMFARTVQKQQQSEKNRVVTKACRPISARLVLRPKKSINTSFLKSSHKAIA